MTTGRYYESDTAETQAAKPRDVPSGKVSIGLSQGPKVACTLEVVDESHWRVVPAEPVDPDDFASLTIDGVPDGIRLIYEYEGRLVDLN